MRHDGTSVCKYSVPPLVISIPVTTPTALIKDDPTAVEPTPTCPNTTGGAEVYPPPPLVISTAVTIPLVVTRQVARAPTLVS